MKRQAKLMHLKRRFTCRLSKTGSVLVVTIWTLLFLSFFCIALSYIVITKINVAAHLRDRTLSYYLAKAGVQAAIQVLDDDETAYDFYGDNWCNNEQFFKEVKLGPGLFSVDYDESGLEYYGIIDEERKLNVNTVSQAVLVSLFVAAGCLESKANQLADCIIDWRDADSEPGAEGAEDIYYSSLEIPYNCKDAAFEVIEELLLVKGMDEEIFSEIKDNVTVFGGGCVNINTANREVLTAIGMTDVLADKVINYRLSLSEGGSVDDERVFETLEDIKEELNLSGAEEEIIDSLTADNLIATSSNHFRVVSSGELDRSKISAAVVCVVDKSGEVKYWRQD